MHPKELLTYLMPNFFGFGGSTYTGFMPFTDFPNYVGLPVLLFAFFSCVKLNSMRLFFWTVLVISILLSFGKYFEIFYQFFYNYLPFFSSFRVPIRRKTIFQSQFEEKYHAGRGTIHDANIFNKFDKFDVETIKLDELTFSNQISFIKIDVEGYEYEAIQGAVDTIKKYEPILMIEVNDRSFEKIKNLLANGSEKIRVGIKPDGKVIARENTKIFSSDNNEIGFVTSGTFGPSVNAPVAMGYVKSEFSEIGTSIQLEVRGKKYGGKISELPFYKKSYVK